MARRLGIALVLLLILQGLSTPLSFSAAKAQDAYWDPAWIAQHSGEVEQQIQRAFTGAARAWDEWFFDMKLKVPNKPILVLVRQGESARVEGCTNTLPDEAVTSRDSTPVYCVIQGPVSNITISTDPSTFDSPPRNPPGETGVNVNGFILMPIETMTAFAYGSHDTGNTEFISLAPAMFLAHEYAHFVQIELSNQLRRTLPVKIATELLADCLAGDLFATAGLSIFSDEENNANILLWSFNRLGDDLPNSEYGTDTQRREAFTFGFTLGTTDRDTTKRAGKLNCLSRYWPGILD